MFRDYLLTLLIKVDLVFSLTHKPVVLRVLRVHMSMLRVIQRSKICGFLGFHKSSGISQPVFLTLLLNPVLVILTLGEGDDNHQTMCKDRKRSLKVTSGMRTVEVDVQISLKKTLL